MPSHLFPDITSACSGNQHSDLEPGIATNSETTAAASLPPWLVDSLKVRRGFNAVSQAFRAAAFVAGSNFTVRAESSSLSVEV